jgi:hypothetical protein
VRKILRFRKTARERQRTGGGVGAPV